MNTSHFLATMIKLASVVLMVTMLGACSLTTDEAPLRSEYAQKTADVDSDQLYWRILLTNLGVGAASQVVPGFHLAGVVVDAGVLVSYFDELIYGKGAILARTKSCPALVEEADYWNVIGAWIGEVHTSAEFDTAMGLATTLTPLVSKEHAAQLFANAIQTHGAKFLGVKLSGIIAAKFSAKGLAGFVPVLGPIVAAGINWYILSGINKSADAYYESKARFVCGR